MKFYIHVPAIRDRYLVPAYLLIVSNLFPVLTSQVVELQSLVQPLLSECQLHRVFLKH